MRLAALLLAAGLCGCGILDQTTFDPEPEAPAVARPAPPMDARAPLVTIRYDVPEPAYQDLLRFAVRAAEARRPGGGYDVITVVPARGAIAEQVNAAQARSRDAGSVARTMTTLGVAPTRLHLGARADPAATAQEVRVYIR